SGATLCAPHVFQNVGSPSPCARSVVGSVFVCSAFCRFTEGLCGEEPWLVAGAAGCDGAGLFAVLGSWAIAETENSSTPAAAALMHRWVRFIGFVGFLLLGDGVVTREQEFSAPFEICVKGDPFGRLRASFPRRGAAM